MEKLRELRRKRKEKKKLEKMLKGDVDKLKDKIEKMKESKASKVSITDPECRFMRLKGFEFCKTCPIRKECVKNKKDAKVVKCLLPEKMRG